MLTSRRRLALAAAGSLTLVPPVYAIIRLFQVWLFPEPDPALVVWSTRIALYWRCGMSLYVAVALAPLFVRWAERAPRTLARAIEALAVVGAAIIALQSAVAP